MGDMRFYFSREMTTHTITGQKNTHGDYFSLGSYWFYNLTQKRELNVVPGGVCTFAPKMHNKSKQQDMKPHPFPVWRSQRLEANQIPAGGHFKIRVGGLRNLDNEKTTNDDHVRYSTWLNPCSMMTPTLQ